LRFDGRERRRKEHAAEDPERRPAAGQGARVHKRQGKEFASPHQSIKASISVIYQERQLVNAMSVMENIFLDDLHENRFGFIDKPLLRRKTQEIIDAFGLPIKPTDVVGRLSVAYQQMIEIMKAYRRDSDIIAFDEPTAPLTAERLRFYLT
jgi:ABC-type sugar transport system ATPase subunit